MQWPSLRVDRAALVGSAALFLLAGVVVGLHVRAYPTLSPIDELQHFDYAVKASSGHLVRLNERVGETAMRAEACHGIDAAFTPPSCDTLDLQPEVYQELGYNTASSQPPIFYAISGVVGRILRAIGVVEDLFVGVRLAGVFWLGIGLVLTRLLMAMLGASWFMQAMACVLLATTPVVVHAVATVNSDASLLVVGAGMILLTIGACRGTIPLWLPIVGAGLTPAIEVTSIIVAGAAALVLLVAAVLSPPAEDDGPSRARLLAAAVGVALAALVVSFVGVRLRGALGIRVDQLPDIRSSMTVTTGLRLGDVLGQIPALVTPVNSPYIPEAFRSVTQNVVVLVTGWALIAANAGRVLVDGGSQIREHRTLATSMAVAALVAGPLIVVFNYVDSRTFFAAPPRYGLSLLPAMFAILAAVPRRRGPSAVLAALAIASTWQFLSAMVG